MHTTVVSVRLAPALLSKLDELCQACAQRRAHMLRWLIASAGLEASVATPAAEWPGHVGARCGRHRGRQETCK